MTSIAERARPFERVKREMPIKRSLDFWLALLLIIALFPLLVMLAVLVRVTSPGPAIYRQNRVGRNGRIIVIWKFRSMCVDAESKLVLLISSNEMNGGPLFKMRRDPRVTSVGRWLRKYSLDELPQLVNVLTGGMSLVGPRPALPKEVATYSPSTRRRLLVKPGLTGLWQVSGRNDLTWDQSVELDLEYVRTCSLLLDVRILARTIPAVLLAHGAY